MGADGSKGCTPWDCMTNNPHDIGVCVGFRMPRSPFRRQRKMLECASSACCRRRSTVLILANAPSVRGCVSLRLTCSGAVGDVESKPRLHRAALRCVFRIESTDVFQSDQRTQLSTHWFQGVRQGDRGADRAGLCCCT